MNPSNHCFNMSIDQLLSSKEFIILDGAMGTELERHGYATTLPLWSAMANLEAPVLVKQIHDDYISAGADIITANTFRTTSYTFSQVGKTELAPHLTRLAVEIARESAVQAGRKVLVAGSLAPLEDCYSPELVPAEDVMREAYTEQIDLLISTGVDFILAETMINRSEIAFISEYLRQREFPFMMSFTTQDGRLLDGTSLESTIPDVLKANPLALLLNCRSCQEITQTLPLLQSLFQGITGAYANGPGHPDPELGWQNTAGGVEQYLDAVKQWLDHGTSIVGGCCGTTPEHIRRISRELRV
jgi:homocysteine S-methyltransferase